MKKRLALKKIFTLKKIVIAVVVIAILAMIAIPWYIQNERNKAAQNFLKQINLAELAADGEHCWPRYGPYFIEGVEGIPEATIMELALWGFRPDPSIVFHILPKSTIDDVTHQGFIALAAHNSKGSIVYMFDSLAGEKIREAREDSEYGGKKLTSSVAALFRYKYDNATDTAEKISNETKYGPNLKDKYPARLVVTVAAD